MKKIWIYQADRFFSDAEKESAQALLDEFIQGWNAHGNKLSGSAQIYHNLFIVLQVDEAVASTTGCSVDKSVHLLKHIEELLHIQLFNRLLVAYRDPQQRIQLVPRESFSMLVREGKVHDDTPVFNNLLSCGEEFPEKWELPFKDSWHAQVFRTS